MDEEELDEYDALVERSGGPPERGDASRAAEERERGMDVAQDVVLEVAFGAMEDAGAGRAPPELSMSLMRADAHGTIGRLADLVTNRFASWRRRRWRSAARGAAVAAPADTTPAGALPNVDAMGAARRRRRGARGGGRELRDGVYEVARTPRRGDGRPAIVFDAFDGASRPPRPRPSSASPGRARARGARRLDPRARDPGAGSRLRRVRGPGRSDLARPPRRAPRSDARLAAHLRGSPSTAASSPTRRARRVAPRILGRPSLER